MGSSGGVIFQSSPLVFRHKVIGLAMGDKDPESRRGVAGIDPGVPLRL